MAGEGFPARDPGFILLARRRAGFNVDGDAHLKLVVGRERFKRRLRFAQRAAEA